MSNAFKFTPNEGTIEVVAKTHTKFETDYVSISVSDTGMGISVDEQQSVFERFYTNKNSKIDNTNGIGLSISYDLIKLHHGQVLVSSELGKGSTFTIEIPIDKAAYSAQEITNTLPTILDSDELETIYEDEIMEEQEHYSPDNSVNVLIVEDNEDILFTIRNILQKQYNVYTASNGAMALEIVKDNNIDIIVSDVMMPEMDGLELCRTIKGDLETSHISILLLTAKNRVEDRIECYEAGTDGYISKPFDMKVLVARISNLLNKKKQKQQEFKANREIKIETLGYPSLDEQFLTDAVKIIENNLSDSDFNIDTYSTLLNLSKSSLYRKLKTMTSLSPNEFIRNIRLKHACQMLKDPSISISEVAYSVGFTDPRYFSTCFRNEFEMTPTEYQKAQN
nr:response regulator [Bacteroides propionicifaciens]